MTAPKDDYLIRPDPLDPRRESAAFVAGWVETIDFILTHKAESVKSRAKSPDFRRA